MNRCDNWARVIQFLRYNQISKFVQELGCYKLVKAKAKTRAILALQAKEIVLLGKTWLHALIVNNFLLPIMFFCQLERRDLEVFQRVLT